MLSSSAQIVDDDDDDEGDDREVSARTGRADTLSRLSSLFPRATSLFLAPIGALADNIATAPFSCMLESFLDKADIVRKM